jgi:hypothetical protein
MAAHIFRYRPIDTIPNSLAAALYLWRVALIHRAFSVACLYLIFPGPGSPGSGGPGRTAPAALGLRFTHPPAIRLSAG